MWLQAALKSPIHLESLRVKAPPRRCLRRKLFHFFQTEGSAVITASTNFTHPGSLSDGANALTTSSDTPVVGFFASNPASRRV